MVRFATKEEIIFALGIPQMENPIPAGIIETTNGLEVPITLDVTYLAGADTAHVNASGISTLNLLGKIDFSCFVKSSSNSQLVKTIVNKKISAVIIKFCVFMTLNFSYS